MLKTQICVTRPLSCVNSPDPMCTELTAAKSVTCKLLTSNCTEIGQLMWEVQIQICLLPCIKYGWKRAFVRQPKVIINIQNINSCKWPTWRTILFSYMFIPNLYMFRALMCSSSGELIVSIRHLVYVTVRRWPCGVQVWVFHPNLHTTWSPTYSDIYQMSYWYN